MPNEMTVVSWRELRKGESLMGFFSLALPSGLKLIDLAYHQRSNGSRWISMPAKSFSKADGGTAWIHMADFVDRPARDRFNDAAIKALDAFFKANPDQAPAKSTAAKPVAKEDIDPF